jgi:hypothetical protein
MEHRIERGRASPLAFYSPIQEEQKEDAMRGKFLLASGLVALGILGQPQTQAQVVKVPNPFCSRSDLQVTVSAISNPLTGGKTLVSGFVVNRGPQDYPGGRRLTITATTNGKTESCLEPTRITALKVQQKGGGFFVKECVAPSGVNPKTVYKATISHISGDCDSNSSNNTATRVGSIEGKP